MEKKIFNRYKINKIESFFDLRKSFSIWILVFRIGSKIKFFRLIEILWAWNRRIKTFKFREVFIFIDSNFESVFIIFIDGGIILIIAIKIIIKIKIIIIVHVLSIVITIGIINDTVFIIDVCFGWILCLNLVKFKYNFAWFWFQI
jgi:hypothetical protein